MTLWIPPSATATQSTLSLNKECLPPRLSASIRKRSHHVWFLASQLSAQARLVLGRRQRTWRLAERSELFTPARAVGNRPTQRIASANRDGTIFKVLWEQRVSLLLAVTSFLPDH